MFFEFIRPQNLGTIFHQLKELVFWAAFWEAKQYRIHTYAWSNKAFNLPTPHYHDPAGQENNCDYWQLCAFRSALAEDTGASQAQWVCGYVREVLCCVLSHVRLFATPWTVAHQAPLCMGFPRQEYWSGLPFPSPGVREVKCCQIKVPFLEEGDCLGGGAGGVFREEWGSGLATRKSKFPSVKWPGNRVKGKKKP